MKNRHRGTFDDWEQFIGSHNLVSYRAVAYAGENIVESSYPSADKSKAEAYAAELLSEGYDEDDVEVLGIWMSLSGSELWVVEYPE